MKASVLLIFLQASHLVLCQSDTNECSDIKKDICSYCIKKPGCAWCSDKSYTKQRCDTIENHEKNNCPNNQTINPMGKSEYPEEKVLDNSDQVFPRKINLTVRVGQPFSFKLKIRPATDYPVDLYYLMDLSNSMADDLETLRTLAGNISRKLNELTSRHRLAFGSYVDKVTLPYVKKENIGKKYCHRDENQVEKCGDAPYNYKHYLDFTGEAAEFQAKIDSAVSSGNYDVPEGLLDSLMQIAACEKELKWNPKEKTRRMVLVATDAPFHIAGEGKFGGITEPNDERCHLVNENNVMQYSQKASLTLDYPTVNQVFRKLKETSIQPIFAAGSTTSLREYQALADSWSDLSATYGGLGKSSENITKLIEESYRRIVSTVKITPSSLPDGIKLTITPNCGNATKYIDSCKAVKPGTNVSFDISVTVDSCEKGNSSFKLIATGFGEVEVNLGVICNCACDSVIELNSSRCNGSGNYVCGACDCHSGRTGPSCECDLSDGRRSYGIPNCKRTNTSTLICEANGECLCGECHCKYIGNKNVKYYGKFCQCSDFICEQYENKLCGGVERGKCKCGKCKCNVGYIGSNCANVDCSLKIEKCLHDGLNCSGKGTCDCGHCKCHPFFEGKYCDQCPSCVGKCDDYKMCVLCEVFGYVPSNKTECEYCPKVVKMDSASKMDDMGFPAKCKYTDDDGCTYRFTYGKNDNEDSITIFALTEKDCPEGPNILLIVLVVVGTIVGIGILLLILWKLFTAMVDRREYEKFEKDMAQSRWHRERNPLFKPATTTVQNPTYTGSQTS